MATKKISCNKDKFEYCCKTKRRERIMLSWTLRSNGPKAVEKLLIEWHFAGKYRNRPRT